MIIIWCNTFQCRVKDITQAVFLLLTFDYSRTTKTVRKMFLLFSHHIISKSTLPALLHPFMAHSFLKICSPSLDLLLHFSRFVWALSSPLRRLSLFSIWDDFGLFKHLRATQREMGKQGEGQGTRAETGSQGSVSNLPWCFALQLWERSQSPAS